MCSAVIPRLVHRVRGAGETSKLKQLQPGLPDHSAQPFVPAWELGDGPCSAPRWSPSSHGCEIRVTVSAPLQPVGLQDPFADPSTLPSPLHHKERDSFHHLSKKSSKVPPPNNTLTVLLPPSRKNVGASMELCSMLAAGFSSTGKGYRLFPFRSAIVYDQVPSLSL